MEENQILFNAPMVRAILEKRKTQTRLAITPLPATNKAGKPYWRTPQNTPRLVSVNTCPIGKVGHHLWVREAFTAPGLAGTETYFRATPLEHPFSLEQITEQNPRKAQSFTLEITNVRIERLHNITPVECFAEGYQPVVPTTCSKQEESSALDWYRTLWESQLDTGTWNANPWVWVVLFNL